MAAENFTPQDQLKQSRETLKTARENLVKLQEQEKNAEITKNKEELKRLENAIQQNKDNVKSAEKVINKLNDAPKDDVNKLISLLKDESQEWNAEVLNFTIQTLKHEFEKREPLLIKILGDMKDGEGAKVKALSILRDAYQKAKGDEKKEVALVIQKFWLAELDIALEDKTREEILVIKGIQNDIAELQRVVVTANTYKIEGWRDTTTDYSIQGNKNDKFSAKKVKGETIKIFNQLFSKDQEMKFKISSHEEAMMKRFVELVDDISNNEGTKFDNVPVEVKLINYMKNNPEAARYNTEEEWIKALADMGLVIRKESWASRILWGKEGAKDLAEFAKIYISAEDMATANNNFSNLRNYVDMIYNEGGFKKTIDGLQKVAQSSKESFKKTKEDRFNTLVGDKNTLTGDILLKHLFDFNLDGVISAGDVEWKSGFQWKKAVRDAQKFNNLSTEKIINNILAVVNKAEGLDEQSKITPENISKFENFEKVQNFLKTTALDAKDIVNYWTTAAKKSLENGGQVESVKKSEITELVLQKRILDKLENEMEQLYKILNQDPWNRPKMVEKKEDRKKIEKKIKDLKDLIASLREPAGKVWLREWLSSVVEQNIAQMKQAWLAVWADIPLDKIVEGASINLTLWSEKLDFNNLNNLSPTKLLNNLWFNLAWNKDLDLGKGWKAFAGANAGLVWAFIPFAQVETGVAKTWGNLTNSLAAKTEITTSVSAFTGISERGVRVGVDRNKNTSREKQAEDIGNSVRVVIADLLMNDGKGNIQITKDQIRASLEKRFNDKSKEKQKEIEWAVSQLTKYLKLYEGLPATKENIIQIADSVSEAYAAAWSNARARELDKEGWYISGVGLSVSFFAECIPIVSLFKFTNHKYSGTVDSLKAQQKQSESIYFAENNRSLSGSISDQVKELQQVRGKEIKVDWNQILIDVSDSESSVFLDSAMKGNIIRDGNYLKIHKDTKLRVVDNSGVWSSSKILNIGADSLTRNAYRLSSLNPANKERFATSTEALKAQETVPMTQKNISDLWQNLQLPTDLKNKTFVVKQNDKEDFTVALVNDPNSKDKEEIILKKNQNLKVTKEGKLVAEDRKEWNFSITVEQDKSIQEKFGFNKDFSDAVDSFYKELASLKDQKLANFIHKKPVSKSLSNYYKDRTFNNAKALFWDIGNSVGLSNSEEFNKVLHYVEKNSNNANNANNDLDYQQQFMLIVDGMLSRTHNVVGRGTGYDIMYWGKIDTLGSFPSLIKNTSSRILNKMENDTNMNGVKERYRNLFNAMNSANLALNENNNYYTTKKLDNTIAYNFGNPKDLMKPIVNPYVVDWVLYKEGSKPEVPEDVKKNLLKELFGADKALVKNLITQIAKDVPKTDDVSKIEDEVSKVIVNSLSREWKLGDGIDIWGKKVIIKADFGTAFFAQCVNHMVTISNIEATIVWGSTIEQSLQGQNISVVQNESDGRTKMTDQKFAVAAGGSIDNREQEQSSGKDRQDGKGKSNPNIWDSPDITPTTPNHGAWNSWTNIVGKKDVIAPRATDE